MFPSSSLALLAVLAVLSSLLGETHALPQVKVGTRQPRRGASSYASSNGLPYAQGAGEGMTQPAVSPPRFLLVFPEAAGATPVPVACLDANGLAIKPEKDRRENDCALWEFRDLGTAAVPQLRSRGTLASVPRVANDVPTSCAIHAGALTCRPGKLSAGELDVLASATGLGWASPNQAALGAVSSSYSWTMAGLPQRGREGVEMRIDLSDEGWEKERYSIVWVGVDGGRS